MVKALLIAVTAVAALNAGTANAGGWHAHGSYSAIPPPGPVHAQHPSYIKPYGIPPRNLGVYYQRTPIGQVCRFFAEYKYDRCWLRTWEPIGSECGCPPPQPGAPWVTGAVAAE